MSLDKGAVYLLIFMLLFFVNINAKIKVCFPYSHNNPFPGKRMGRHIKLYMLGYAFGPYE